MGITIEFKNGELEAVHGFLTGIKLQGSASRARTALCKEVARKYTELCEARTEVQREFGELDEEGDLVADKEGVMAFESEEKRLGCIEEVDKLMGETAVVDCIELAEKIGVLLSALNGLEEGLAGEEATIYDLICTQLEKAVQER